MDSKLLQISTLSTRKARHSCIVYVSDLYSAKPFFVKHDVEIIREFPFIKAFEVKTDISQIKQIAKWAVVDYVSSKSIAKQQIDIAKQVLNHYSLKARREIGVAVIDTGISRHLDFCLGRNRIIKFVDFVNGKESPYDDNGHGTFVAGICAGSGVVSNKKYSGFAPECNIITLKALNEKGEGDAGIILSAMQWIYDNYKKYNIRVVCMSFGSEPLGINDPIMRGAEALWLKGIFVVTAAGNSGAGFGTIKSPGVSPLIMTVGGLDDRRKEDDSFDKKLFTIPEFSSRGPAFNRIKPDVIAPAVNIRGASKKDFYTAFSGTSVATPMIAGLALQLLYKNPKYTPDFLKRKIMRSCSPVCHIKYLEGEGLPSFEKMILR